jgi:alkylation response protein AidB-like acyl-CoA dehydrogenase
MHEQLRPAHELPVGAGLESRPTCSSTARPEQIERYLLPDVRGDHRHAYAITEEHAGSDARGIRAEAVRDGDVYRLSGTKWFVTDGDIASYFLVLAWAVRRADASRRCSSSTRTSRASR